VKRLALVLSILLVAPAAAVASRGPTYLEKVTIMDAFNIPGRSFLLEMRPDHRLDSRSAVGDRDQSDPRTEGLCRSG